MYIKKILIAIVLIGLVIAGCFSYYIYNVMFVPNTAFNNDKAYIYIHTNSDYNQVKSDLAPLLKDIETFDALAKQKKYTSNVKAGKFIIKKGMNNNEIINSIRSKNIPVKVSFNNQNTLAQLAGRISKQIEPDSLQLLKAFKAKDFLSKNKFTLQTALGMYLPNSYEVFWNITAEKFKKRMFKEYNAFWNTQRTAKAKALGFTKNEVMTLASIVYEESKQKSEQPRIAGVYINRLNNNWTLDADPTLKFSAYQLPEYKNTIIKRVLNKHKAIDSPYNTYKYAGLPPGLIAMPDVSAIDAVLNYEKHAYFFFAANAEKPGYHNFAKTLAQHNQNATNYHRYLNKKGIVK